MAEGALPIYYKFPSQGGRWTIEVRAQLVKIWNCLEPGYFCDEIILKKCGYSAQQL